MGERKAACRCGKRREYGKLFLRRQREKDRQGKRKPDYDLCVGGRASDRGVPGRV